MKTKLHLITILTISTLLLLFTTSCTIESDDLFYSDDTTSQDEDSSSEDNQETNPNQPPIYVTIVTHNEEPLSGTYPDFTTDTDAYKKYSIKLIDFAQTLKENNIPFHFQSDWNFLLATSIYEIQDIITDIDTNNKNIIQFLSEDLDVYIDPHAHESEYNYADVAYLIEQLNITSTTTVGGFIASPPEDSKLEYLQDKITADIYKTTSYTWTTSLLWGAGTSGHKNEEDFYISGIWRPKNNQEFTTHDNSNTNLPYIGSLKSDWDNLDILIDLQIQNKLNQNQLYTHTIFISHKDIASNANQKEFLEQLDYYQEKIHQNQANIIFINLPDLLTLWQQDYNQEPMQLSQEDAFKLLNS